MSTPMAGSTISADPFEPPGSVRQHNRARSPTCAGGLTGVGVFVGSYCPILWD